ncbi:MAG: hypothetical protein C4562_02215 [Actinobacteria bacterium]|nr:MAG: hypothetical protein C4562_02215 [Actinomycetota bacterium]
MFSYFKQKKLIQNSLYLILSQAAMAFFGFFFWVINKRLFNPTQIGLAALLISAMNLISILSVVGLDTTLVRFLWHSKKRNAKINTAMAIVAITAFLLAVCFILSLSIIAPKLLFMHNSPWLMLGFVIFCITASWNVLTDSVFLAYRKASYILFINGFFSLEKMLLPLAFFAFGVSGIFASAGIASFTGAVLSFGVMIAKFDYKPQITIDRQIISEVKSYSSAYYIKALCHLLPATVIPFIVAGYLGAAKAGDFYITFMIANLLFVIAFSANRSLLAEGSHAQKDLPVHLRQAIWFIILLFVPAVAILFIAAPALLQIFKIYASDAIAFLRLMVLSGIAVSSLSVVDTVFEVCKQSKPLIVNSIIYAFSIIAGCFIVLQSDLGLMGIGWAWIAGNIITTLIGVVWLRVSNLISVSQS